MPSIATTRRGRAWLANFGEDEQSAALRLLDGLEMVSDNQFRRELKELIARARRARSDTIVAAYSVHTLPKSFAPHYFECGVAHARRPPLLCPPVKRTGSEAIVQNVLHKVAGSLDILVDCTVEELYKARVDRILLITDNVASGQEMETFLSFMQANPRLRSWRSFGWLQFEIVSHSITESALVKLDRRAVIHFEQLSRTFETTDWRGGELEEVRALCKKYGSIRKQALGWRDAESLQLFGHTFGNGTPAILRQRRDPRGETWSPLLPHERDFGLESAQAVAMQNHRAPHNLLTMLHELRGTIAGRMPRIERVSKRARRDRLFGDYSGAVIALVATIDAGHSRPIDLMKAGSMSLSRLHQVARVAQELGLIDGYPALVLSIGSGAFAGDSKIGDSSVQPRLRLTKQGQNLLRRRGRKRGSRATSDPRAMLTLRENDTLATEAIATDRPQPYYPQQLR